MDNATPESRHTLLMIDLDRFKPINDTLGHPIGDALLCLVAQRLRRETREEDLLVRLGGDEFLILLAGGERAEALAARVVDILSRPFLVEGQIANIGASVGIARFPEHGPSADDLMRHADLALYDAKCAGGRAWRVFEPTLAVEAHARRALETDLRKALSLGELSLAYQAQFNVGTRTLTGFEALAALESSDPWRCAARAVHSRGGGYRLHRRTGRMGAENRVQGGGAVAGIVDRGGERLAAPVGG